VCGSSQKPESTWYNQKLSSRVEYLNVGWMHVVALEWMQLHWLNSAGYVCWHGIWPDGLCGFRPKAAGLRPVSCSPHGPPPAPMPSMPAFPYIFACLSHTLLFR
jgi:hypothetical protein